MSLSLPEDETEKLVCSEDGNDENTISPRG